MTKKMILTIAALGVSVLSAQPGQGRGGTPPTPEQMMEKRLERLTTLLSLTPSQVTTIKALYTAEAAAVTALKTPMEAAHTALRDAVNSNAPEPQIDRAAAQIGTLQGQMTAIHSKTQAKFLATLTADQKKKLETLGEGRGPGGMGPGGPGGPGVPRGPAFSR